MPLSKNSEKVQTPTILVIFGATGDLTSRKLMPALYNLSLDNQLPSNFACVGFARREKTHEVFRNEMKADVTKFSRNKPIKNDVWESFEQKLYYHVSDFDKDAGYIKLKAFLEELDKKHGTNGNRVFYLSTQPSFFTLIVEKLQKNGLIYPLSDKRTSRVIIEKPFGSDLASSIELQKNITKALAEEQLYRIDHYLGKETVQNLLVFRFANTIFESIWNNRYVDHIQITVSEELGIGTRGLFFEEAGILRDIVQNHMMQILSLVAMEPPVSLSADAIRDEKVKVLQAIRPLPMENFDQHVVRGQYAPGTIDQKTVVGYRQENNVSPLSNIETFVALELFIDSWRWVGVPFYLRAGKRLPKRTTEISIVFKEIPAILFQSNGNRCASNTLTIRIQPNEGIALNFNSKIPGPNSPIQPVKMDFRYDSYFGMSPPEAYERLICDCMLGDSTLFARIDEVEASWKFLTPILERWATDKDKNLYSYPAGSWGPQSSDSLLAGRGKVWHL